MREGISLFILIKRLTYYNAGVDKTKETPKIHYMMFHWGLLPRLTTEVVPQGLYTIMTSRKEVNTSPWGYNNIQ